MFEITLGRGNHVGTPTQVAIVPPGQRRARWFATQTSARHADAKLQPDQVIGFVHRRVLASLVGHQTVFLEAAAHILAPGVAAGTEHHVHAPAQIAKHRATVAFHAGYHLHHAMTIEQAADAAWPHHMREVVDATGREQQTTRRRQVTGIGDGGHLDGALGAVEKTVEHLRVHAAFCSVLGRDAVVRPHGRRRALVILRQILGALARSHHLETRCAAPVHHLAHQRRLVAVGQRVHDARLARLACQQWPGQGIGLDVDHHDVLLRVTAGQHMRDAVCG